MNESIDSATPAELLAGKELPGGWKVEELIRKSKNSTGGHFSSSYIVCSTSGQKAFLKAMDYARALQEPRPSQVLEKMTAAYNFERDLLEKCKSKNLTRIVRVLDSGTLRDPEGSPISSVEYIVFELAKGDIRSFFEFEGDFDNAWALRTIHHAAAALRQLHYVEVAHQDLKPSNVLVFADSHSKLADLGRASDRHIKSPNDSLKCAGDLSYAPPEHLYRHHLSDWRMRRLACDMYLLGSLIVFFFTRVSMTHLLLKYLDDQYHYLEWGGDYYDVLPYLQNVFSKVIRELRQFIPDAYASDIVDSINQLCNLDPQKRGHPKNIMYRGNQYSLERYVSLFNLLARKAERQLYVRPLKEIE